MVASWWLSGEDLAVNVLQAAMFAIAHVSQVQNQSVRGFR